MSYEKRLRSMTMRRATPPDETTVTLSWTIRSLDANNQEQTWNPFAEWLAVQAELPETGEKATGYIPSTTSADWSAYFRCRTVDLRYVDQSQAVWEATATFSSKDPWCPHPHVYRTDQTQPRAVEMYRDSNPTAAMLSSTASTHTVQTGNAIDEKGKPVPRDVTQQVVNVSFIWNTSIAVNGVAYPDVAQLIQDNWFDCRSSAEFLGWPTGTVRLMGVSVDPDRDEYVRVTYQFIYDPWGFMTQVPKLNPAKAGPVTAFFGSDEHAEPVYWKQGWTVLQDFNELFTDYEIDWLTYGWQTYDDTVCTQAAGSTSYETKPNEATVGSTAGYREYPPEAVP